MVTKSLERHWTFETRPDDDSVWSHATVGDATVERVEDHWALSLTATDEAQQARVDLGGNLMLDVTRLRMLTFLVQFSTIPSGVNAYLGLALANNATVNDIATRVLFQANGSNDLVLRLDDGVIDTGSLPAGVTILPDEKMEFTIDFASGIDGAIPNHLSKTGKDALRFYVTRGSAGRRELQRRGVGLSNYSLGLQPFIRMDKASGTAVAPPPPKRYCPGPPGSARLGTWQISGARMRNGGHHHHHDIIHEPGSKHDKKCLLQLINFLKCRTAAPRSKAIRQNP
ncbi:MAG: hypothetical protein Q8M16_07180, partial [Pirellulaceae bacterium]|nr:hypothetical protein [Pirellulaceae bacterium]